MPHWARVDPHQFPGLSSVIGWGQPGGSIISVQCSRGPKRSVAGYHSMVITLGSPKGDLREALLWLQ